MISRRSLAAALGGLLVAAVAQAGPIFSGPSTTNTLGGTLVFDLLAGGDLASMADLSANPSDYNIQVISSVWSFAPPKGATGFLDLGGTLALGGVDAGLNFAQTINMADVTGNVIFSQNNGGPSGLPFQYQLAQQLIANNGKFYGNIIPNPGTTSAWDAYFATGGTLTQYLFVQLTLKPNDLNQAPEPAALLVWGSVGAIGFMAHRWNRRRKAAKV